jgi:hypothetical protein
VNGVLEGRVFHVYDLSLGLIGNRVTRLGDFSPIRLHFVGSLKK